MTSGTPMRSRRLATSFDRLRTDKNRRSTGPAGAASGVSSPDRNRTAVINRLLLEHRIAVRQGHRFLRQQLPRLVATRTDVLSPRMVRIIEDLVEDWAHLDDWIERVTDELEGLARTDEWCGRSTTVPGCETSAPWILETAISDFSRLACACILGKKMGHAYPGEEISIARRELSRHLARYSTTV
jgi:hypothetical protein